MTDNDGLNIATNPDLDQHFLSNPAKLSLLVKAAGIQRGDHVVEAGAGVGTIAEHLPLCQSLTVIEYDTNLIPQLRKRVPYARIVQGDALTILPTLCCDVLLSNLPSKLTPAVVRMLPTLDFRVAVMVVSSIDELAPLDGVFVLEAVVIVEPHDFRPPQSVRAEVVRVTRAGGGGHTGRHGLPPLVAEQHHVADLPGLRERHRVLGILGE